MSLAKRHQQAWHSFRSLPLWVQVWVAGILVPVNAAAFFFLDTPTGQWTALAAVLVMATNWPIMVWEQGMSRLMSVPHLIIWLPLEVALLYRLQAPELAQSELILAWVIVAINGISLVFDALDTWRWCRGEREVPGRA